MCIEERTDQISTQYVHTPATVKQVKDKFSCDIIFLVTTSIHVRSNVTSIFLNVVKIVMPSLAKMIFISLGYVKFHPGGSACRKCSKVTRVFFQFAKSFKANLYASFIHGIDITHIHGTMPRIVYSPSADI